MQKYLIYLLPAFLMAACTVDLDVPLPEHTERIVVNSFLRPDQAPEVYLTRSYGPVEEVENLDLNLYEADAELFANGQSIGKLAYIDTTIQTWDFMGNPVDKILGKYYLPNYQPEPGTRYELRVSHPQYEAVRAETEMGSPITLQDFEIEQNVRRKAEVDGYSQAQSLLKFKVNDPGGEKNYYFIDVTISYPSPWAPGEQYRERLWNVEGPVDGTDQSGAFTASEQWLSDGEEDGQLIEAEFLTYLPNAWDEPNLIQPLQIDTIFVTLYNANEDTYQYLRKLDQQRNSQDFDIPFFPTESIVVYNNIENGYGIFGSLTQSKQVIVP
jgi:hypothetical protein